MFGLVPGGAVLRSVEVRGTSTDALRLRRGLEHALRDVEWSPSGLAPPAVVFVRRLAPETGGAPRPFATRVSDALAGKVRRARRPWIHGDAAQAEAVWFADEAELVACLARDTLRGTWDTCWWWRGMFGSATVREFVGRHVLPRGDVLAPAIALLASRGTAVAWVARLQEVEATRALDAVGRAHGIMLPGTRDAPPLPLPAPPDRRSTPPPLQGLRVFEAEALRRLGAAVPEALHLSPGSSGRRLLAVALVLAREPAWARTPGFRAALDALDRAHDIVPHVAPETRIVCESSTPDVPRKDDVHHASTSREVSRDEARRRPEDAPRPVAAARSPVTRPTLASTETPVTPTAGPARAHMGDAPAESAPVAEPVASPAPIEARARVEEPERTTARSPAAPAVRAIDASEFALEPVVRVATSFGGIFYLLNAALALGLYGDFTTPRTRGIALLPWDWLALVGRAWFAGAFMADPVWDLLARLAGRGATDEPGRDFAAPSQWAVDEGWLAPWGEVRLRVQHTRTRRLVLHPARFAVRDEPRAAGRRRPAPSRDRARWLTRLREYMLARLASALGEPDASSVPARLCRYPAQVSVTAGALDVHLALADLPLAIRVAGLDRDPGWIPAAGRNVAFHFQ